MKRVVILGRGGSGKSTLASKLGKITGLPVIELDKMFWQPGLHALPRDEWVKMQRRLVVQKVGSWMETWGNTTQLKQGCQQRIRSSCLTSRWYVARGGPYGEGGSATIFGDG